MNSIQSPKMIDYIQLTLLGAIWGSAFIAIEIAITNFNAIQVSISRIFLAGIFLLPLVMIKKHKLPRDKVTWFFICITALLNNAIPFSLVSWGQQHINSGTAAIILACGPFTTLLVGHIFTKDEKISTIKLLGIVLGFIGVFILFFQDFIIKDDLSLLGKAAVFLASCCYVVSGFLIRKLTNVSALMCSSCMFFVSTLILLPFILHMPLPNFQNTDNSIYAIIYLAIIPTASASILRVKLIQKVGMQFISQVSYLIPMFAILWAIIFFNEHQKESTWLAFLLIIVGLAISKLKKVNFSKKNKEQKITFSNVHLRAAKNADI